jgi:outer membrane protein TolC
VVFNVKQAYYTLLQAAKNLDVAIETVKLNRDQLDQAKGFFDAGVKSKYDVTSAEVNLSNARLVQIRAENAVQIARVTLKNAMGAPDLPDFSIVDTLAFQKYPVTFTDAIQRAYTNRPDLQSTLARKEASKEAVSLARTGYYPTLSGNASVTRTEKRMERGRHAQLPPVQWFPDELPGEGGEGEPERAESQRGNASPGHPARCAAGIP